MVNEPPPSSYSGIPEEIRPVIEAAIEVLTSGIGGTILALTQNVYEFRDKVRLHKSDAAKNEKIATLEHDMEAVKRVLKEAFSKAKGEIAIDERDFKTTQGTTGAGGHQEKKHHLGEK